MTVAAILKHKGRDVISIPPSMGVLDIARTLTEHRIGAVLVMDEARRVLGIVSERDIVRCIASHGAATLGMTADRLMTRVLHTVTPETTVAEAMERITQSRVRHLPVLENGELVGLVSIGDVVKARISQQETEVDSLKAYVVGAA